MIQNIALWLIIGIWVAYKRDWYKKFEYDDPPQGVYLFFTVALGPIALFIAFLREMAFKKWDNEN